MGVGAYRASQMIISRNKLIAQIDGISKGGAAPAAAPVAAPVAAPAAAPAAVPAPAPAPAVAAVAPVPVVVPVTPPPAAPLAPPVDQSLLSRSATIPPEAAIIPLVPLVRAVNLSGKDQAAPAAAAVSGDTCELLFARATVLMEQHKASEALPLFQRALEAQQKAAGVGASRLDEVQYINGLAGCMYALRQFDSALPLLDKAIDMQTKVRLGIMERTGDPWNGWGLLDEPSAIKSIFFQLMLGISHGGVVHSAASLACRQRSGSSLAGCMYVNWGLCWTDS